MPRQRTITDFLMLKFPALVLFMVFGTLAIIHLVHCFNADMRFVPERLPLALGYSLGAYFAAKVLARD